MDKLLEAFGIDARLFIIQVVNFGVLIIALWYLLYRPVLKVLKERSEKIAQGVMDAEAAKEKLEGADAEAASRVNKADAEASEILTSARDAGKEEKAKIVKEAEERAAKVAADADARAKEAAARALRESEQEIARLAILAAGKAMGDKK